MCHVSLCLCKPGEETLMPWHQCGCVAQQHAEGQASLILQSRDLWAGGGKDSQEITNKMQIPILLTLA